MLLLLKPFESFPFGLVFRRKNAPWLEKKLSFFELLPFSTTGATFPWTRLLPGVWLFSCSGLPTFFITRLSDLTVEPLPLTALAHDPCKVARSTWREVCIGLRPW